MTFSGRTGSPDGKQLAIVREVAGAQQLEYPIGKVLYRSAGWLESVRVSPGGDLVAFLDHPARGDDGGTVAVVDTAGKKRALGGAFASGHGLAWGPSGDEVWYTAAKVGGNRALYAASLRGAERTLYRITGNLTLQDVAADGRVLVTQDVERLGNLGRGPGQEKEVELTWLDWSLANDLSPDGRTLLFTESGEGGGPGYSAYTRSTDGAPRGSPGRRQWPISVAGREVGRGSARDLFGGAPHLHLPDRSRRTEDASARRHRRSKRGVDAGRQEGSDDGQRARTRAPHFPAPPGRKAPGHQP